MNRSGYSDDLDAEDLNRWRGQVASAIRGKRGQKFLKELAEAMDAMPEKVLIAQELINADGDCCAIGVVCKIKGIDVSQIDVECPEEVGKAVGIAHQLAAEIEYENDYNFSETPQNRWYRMRSWVDSKLNKGN